MIGASPAMSAALPLSLEGITCQFPGVKALDDITIAFQPGEIHAITGENGAGKSTLLKVLSGTVSPVSGIIRIGHTPYPAIRDALSLGIRAIPQEPLIAQNLSVAENIQLGNLPLRRFGLVDWKQVFNISRTLLERVGLTHVQPGQPVRGLGIGEQQLIQTARALAGPGTIFLFDEPTSSLAGNEVDRLFDIIRDLARRGAVVLYVSHRVPELFHLCHRATVLRDGRLIGSKLLSQTTPGELIRMMVGRNLVLKGTGAHPPAASTALEVVDVRPQRHLPPISFNVNHGEILGIAGLVGSGRTELLDAVFGVGAGRAANGSVLVDGNRLRIRSPRDAVSGNIAYVPGDRKRDGLVISLGMDDNLALPNLGEVQPARLSAHQQN